MYAGGMNEERPEDLIAAALSQIRMRGGSRRGEWRSRGERGDGGEHRHGRGGMRGATWDRGGEGGVRSGGESGHHRHANGRERPGFVRDEHEPGDPPPGGPALRRLVQRLAAAEHPMSVSDIAGEVGVDQPRASRLVAQGVDLGMLRREADPEDARRTRIGLTHEGEQAAAQLRAAHGDVVAAALGGFSDDEKQQLAHLLTKLAEGWRRPSSMG